MPSDIVNLTYLVILCRSSSTNSLNPVWTRIKIHGVTKMRSLLIEPKPTYSFVPLSQFATVLCSNKRWKLMQHQFATILSKSPVLDLRKKWQLLRRSLWRYRLRRKFEQLLINLLCPGLQNQTAFCQGNTFDTGFL